MPLYSVEKPGENSIKEPNIIRFDIMVDNVYSYSMDMYVSNMVGFQNRIGGWAKENKKDVIEKHFKLMENNPNLKIHWRTPEEYFKDPYDVPWANLK